jgi:SpoVK/Ycf46/Vps4 family AAA+-type ATPase
LRAEQNATVNSEDVFQAARAQSDQSLGKLAVKVGRIFSWEDLVLPAPTLRQVKEVAAAIKNRHVVYAQWGFEHRVAFGRGLKVLFSGASGTGKTMTAGVIARELGLDLYKIDLSSVVSKYIGETEKNLDQIFRAAHSSNAILFFDEADALFGKRSEVKDAHDRYANIEVAYLLQKLEEHEGAVILASNLSRNIDDAFSRRMHYVVQFPLPNESYREQLWRGMFPAQTPLSEDIDFGFLARQFPMSGGDIKNVALDAAFLAADDGQVITMKQLVKAMARQVIKQGKIPAVTDFKQYHAFLARDA